METKDHLSLIESIITLNENNFEKLASDKRAFAKAYLNLAPKQPTWKQVKKFADDDVDLYTDKFYDTFKNWDLYVSNNQIEKSDIENDLDDLLYSSIFDVENLSNAQYQHLKKWAMEVFEAILKSVKVKIT